MEENKQNLIQLKTITTIWVNFMSQNWSVAILFLFSCISNQTWEEKLVIQDIDLKLAHDQEIDIRLSSLGIIDITSLSNSSVLDNLNLKVARSNENSDEMFSIVLLDKNGNGLHDDFGIDLIALAPNNWLELNGERFNHLNFVPIKENQAIYIYDHFEAIRDINERMAKTSLSKRADDYITFPYTIPQLVKNTIDDEAIDFRELTEKKKFVYFEFWGTWCKPCVAQIPDLKRLEKEYGDQVMIVGISSNDKKEKLIEVVSKLNMAWPQIQMDEEISEAFGNVYSFPLGVLYDQHGKLISFGIKPKDITRVLSRNE